MKIGSNLIAWLWIIFGVLFIYEAFTRRLFRKERERREADEEEADPQLFHRLAFAALGVFALFWGARQLRKGR